MGPAAAILLSAFGLAAAAVWAVSRLVAAVRASQREAARTRLAQLLAIFAPGVAAAAADPRALLVWHPLAQAARAILPDDFVALDRGAGRTFPFGRDHVEAAHAAWTASWLAWERSHDAEYKLKAQALAESLGPNAATALGRSKLEAVEREKVERYQRRYEEYTKVAKALQRLAEIGN